jgi:hypothetical protein
MELQVYILDMLSLSFEIYYLYLVVKFLIYNWKAVPQSDASSRP